jgi:hypothetical protein
MLTAALAYAARGWHVFPLVPAAKRPAVKDWETRATTDPTRIERCWSCVPAGGPYGIGIATGPSGLVVIDLDQPKTAGPPPPPWNLPGVLDGADVFTVVCEQAGMPVPWDTYAVNTTRGGTHLYYHHPRPNEAGEGIEPVARLRNTAGTLGWLIDTRAHGGYVVAPPTLVEARPYTPGHDAPVAPLPPWLAALLTPKPVPACGPVTVRLTGTDARRGAYLEAAINGAVAAVLAAAQGQRNRALYGAAVQLGQLVAGGELPADTVTTLLETTGHTVGQSPTEARRTVASGLRAGTTRPRTLTPPTSTMGAAA